MSDEHGEAVSPARRQRQLLDAIETVTETEDRAKRANAALEEAQRNQRDKEKAFLKSLDK